jgi:hypothetical protein
VQGVVTGLNRLGGNITGFGNITPQLTGAFFAVSLS